MSTVRDEDLHDEQSIAAGASARARLERFGTLPDPVRPEDVVATQEALVTPDPAFGSGADVDWVLRHAG